MNSFAGRTLVIATMHQKEKVIAPILEQELGVHCIVLENFNTDVFGAFSGEIERKTDPISAARNKINSAKERCNFDLFLASEGSFGPHPTAFFSYADDEILLLVDFKNKLEIGARELSLETNFNAETIEHFSDLKRFALEVKFPSHGIILRTSETDFSQQLKGITDWKTLEQHFQLLRKKAPAVYVETDMRAFVNPSRMSVIEKTCHKLVKKVKSLCPQCQTPGFGKTAHTSGLPCSLCQAPTRSTLSFVYSCQKCNFSKEEMFPHGKKTEDPQFCDSCNP